MGHNGPAQILSSHKLPPGVASPPIKEMSLPQQPIGAQDRPAGRGSSMH